jgi:hypothetical protein
MIAVRVKIVFRGFSTGIFRNATQQQPIKLLRRDCLALATGLIYSKHCYYLGAVILARLASCQPQIKPW